MKEVADFKVFTKGAGSGELKVTVKGPSECRGPGLGGGRAGRKYGPWFWLPEGSDYEHHAPPQRDSKKRLCPEVPWDP